MRDRQIKELGMCYDARAPAGGAAGSAVKRVKAISAKRGHAVSVNRTDRAATPCADDCTCQRFL